MPYTFKDRNGKRARREIKAKTTANYFQDTTWTKQKTEHDFYQRDEKGKPYRKHEKHNQQRLRLQRHPP